MSERMDGLLEYADRLIRLNEHGYNCYDEIDECIQEMRKELGIHGYEMDLTGFPRPIEVDSATKQHLEFLKNNPPVTQEMQKEADEHYDKVQSNIDEQRERMRKKGKQIGKQKG